MCVCVCVCRTKNRCMTTWGVLLSWIKKWHSIYNHAPIMLNAVCVRPIVLVWISLLVSWLSFIQTVVSRSLSDGGNGLRSQLLSLSLLFFRWLVLFSALSFCFTKIYVICIKTFRFISAFLCPLLVAQYFDFIFWYKKTMDNYSISIFFTSKFSLSRVERGARRARTLCRHRLPVSLPTFFVRKRILESVCVEYCWRRRTRDGG